MPQVHLAGAEIDEVDDLDAHLRRHRGDVFLADRTIHDLAHVVVVAEHIPAGEGAIFRKLLLDLERGHRAHFEIAALDRRQFGALPEQRGIRMHRDRDLPGQILLDILLELIERAREPVLFGACGRHPELDRLALRKDEARRGKSKRGCRRRNHGPSGDHVDTPLCCAVHPISGS